MKKKILLILGITTLIFLSAGIYIIINIERTTSALDTLVKLHQVEILRERLLLRIKRVQSDLGLQGTRYSRGVDTIVRDTIEMGEAVEVCFQCHHTEDISARLLDLKNHIEQYKKGLSRVLTIRANVARIAGEEDLAFRTGDELTAKVNSMIALTQTKLAERTTASLGDIRRTKLILFIVLTLGPLLTCALALLSIGSFTKPVNELLKATRKLKSGDLDYRVGLLKDEFGEVAESFNEMAGSLKKQLYRIEESEKRYRALFERAGDAIFMFDADGENRLGIVSANQAAAAMYGHTVDELLTLKITDLDLPAEKAATAALFDRILKGEWVNAEMVHKRKDGTVFPVEVSAGLLELGDHKYILAFDRDVTVRKQAEDALQRAEQLKVTGDLAAGLTHELKNSLAGIKVSIEVLLEELALSDEDRMVMMNMMQEIRRIELLMRDLLTFARPSKPQFILVNINTVLDTAMTFSLKNASSAPGRSKRITVVREFDECLPRTMADPMQLQQVFMNLLLNAVEAMPEGGSLTVRTAYNAHGDQITISISDSGKGIDEELMESVFEPFFTTKPKGTGLGLPITKRLIEQHNGGIRITNGNAGGTTFIITFPVKHFEEVKNI